MSSKLYLKTRVHVPFIGHCALRPLHFNTSVSTRYTQIPLLIFLNTVLEKTLRDRPLVTIRQ